MPVVIEQLDYFYVCDSLPPTHHARTRQVLESMSRPTCRTPSATCMSCERWGY